MVFLCSLTICANAVSNVFISYEFVFDHQTLRPSEKLHKSRNFLKENMEMRKLVQSYPNNMLVLQQLFSIFSREHSSLPRHERDDILTRT